MHHELLSSLYLQLGFFIVRQNAAWAESCAGDLPDVSMVEEDFNVREETININDTEIEETIDIDSEHTIELSDSYN